MPIFNDPSVLSALHIVQLTTTVGADLSADLQRQIRHVAHEFVLLREAHLGAYSDRTGARSRAEVLVGLQTFFADELGRGTGEDILMERAKVAEITLREIRSLQGIEHFFSETLEHFYTSLALFDPSDLHFGHRLRWELEKYRKQRDAAEATFLKPFHDYCDEMLAIINEMRKDHPFTEFEVQFRIKRDLLSKLHARLESKKWESAQEFYDLVGLRIVVGNQREVDAASALLKGAFLVHESKATLRNLSYHFGIDNTETHESPVVLDAEAHQPVSVGEVRKSYNKRGYRAVHVNVRRHDRENGNNHPTAEIQIMSRGIHDWGAIQRLLVYKDEGIPEDVKSVVTAYCKSTADYIAAVEDGETVGATPDLGANILILNHIPSDALKSDVLDRLADMDFLVRKYEKRRATVSAGS